MERPLKTFDSDREDAVKDWYEKIYKNLQSGRDKYRTMYLEKSEKSIRVNGDQCINIKLGNPYDCLGSIVKIGETPNDNIKELNDLIVYYSHTILNYSVLPVTGGLNNIKWRLGSDRIDTFIFVLDQYYKGINQAVILNSGSSNGDIGTRNKLKEILDSFGSVDGFVSVIYGIDPITSEEFVKRAIDSGSKPILGIAGLCDYMNLAVDFWELRFDMLLKSGVFKLGESKQKVVRDDFKSMRERICQLSSSK